MTITKTADVDGTLAQIYALRRGRAPTSCAARATRSRRPRGWPGSCPARRCRSSPTSTTSTSMALAALEAGVHCLRLNPGNIRKPEHIKTVAQECKDRGVPIRIGVNGGSLDPDAVREVRRQVTPEAHGRVGPDASWPTSTRSASTT